MVLLELLELKSMIMGEGLVIIIELLVFVWKLLFILFFMGFRFLFVLLLLVFFGCELLLLVRLNFGDLVILLMDLYCC